MPTFRYKAIAADGIVHQGEMDAPSREAVVQRIQAEGHTLVRATERGGGLMAALTSDVGGSRAVSRRDLVALTRDLASMLTAGVTLEQALALRIERRAKMREVDKLVERVLKSVREGESLSDGLAAEKPTFSEQYVSMVRAGEIGGTLPQTFVRLTATLEREQATREALQSALIYPIILLVTAAIAITTILVYVLPSFQTIFDQAGADLPAVTRVVVDAGAAVRSLGLFTPLLIIGVVIVANRLLAAEPARQAVDRIALRTPLVGDLARQTDFGRAAAVLGALLANGVPLNAALELARSVPVNRAIRAGLRNALNQVVEGRGLAEPLAESGIAPHEAVQLVRVGEETGKLDDMLTKVSEILEDDARRTIDRLMAMLTPALTIGLGAFVALIVMSILSAVLSINDLAY